METGKLLIVEDEKPLSHALELKLQHGGYNVTVASNGQECIDLVSSQHFDVVLLDLIMPVLDGFQVLEKMGKMPQMPAVFVLSNLSQHEDEQYGAERRVRGGRLIHRQRRR